MIELGYYSLIFAWVMSLFALVALWFSRKAPSVLRAIGYRAVIAAFILVSTASLALVVLLINRDFRVAYVASYTSLDLPLVYVVTAFWGGQAGSLLFWTLLLALFAFLVIRQNRGKHEDFLPYLALVIVAVQHFFLSVILYTANPFQTLARIPVDGRGLNPLLQNFFMVIHPPFLYLGYVAFTVPFAFAIAALALRRRDADWIRLSRRWTLASWSFLTAGILLGAYWAYIELGWGGYWAWDPVENASLMPWLVATAFLHSVMVQQREGMFRRWNFALIILTFELCIFGTFLTRSGVVSSVHAFGDSGMGPLFLVFMGTTAALSLFFVATRARETRSDKSLLSMISRESGFFVLNLLFLALTAAVMWGTMYPAFAQAAGGEKVSITAEFFNRVTWPLALAILLLLAAAPAISWRKTQPSRLLRNLILPAIVAAAVTVLLLVFGIRHAIALAFFAVSSAVIASMLLDYAKSASKAAEASGQNAFAAFFQQVLRRKRHYGAVFVHMGVGFAFLGILASSAFTEEYDVNLKKGQPVTFGDYRAELLELSERRDRNKNVVYARIGISSGERFVGEVRPEKHFHFKFEQPQTEVAIKSRLTEDVYFVLLGWEQDGTVVARINVNPFISLLWLGGLMIMAGGLYVLLPSPKSLDLPASETTAEITTALGERPPGEVMPAVRRSRFAISFEPETEQEEKR
jgi:cytochrome c-type biogenesis protein CcmF